MTRRLGGRPPRGIPADQWRRLVWAVAQGIAAADCAHNDGTPEEYAEEGLRRIAGDLRKLFRPA